MVGNKEPKNSRTQEPKNQEDKCTGIQEYKLGGHRGGGGRIEKGE